MTAPMIAPLRLTVPKILWQPALPPPPSEDWAYADGAARNAAWPLTYLLASGGLAGGVTGLDFTVSAYFAGGIGGVGGRLYVEATFVVPPGTYTVSVPVSDVAYLGGALDIGMDLSGDGLGGGSHLSATDGVDETLSGSVSAASYITIRLGILDLEYAFGSTTPGTITFGPLTIEGPPPDDPLTLEFGYPMQGVRSWTSPSPGSERVRYPSGASAAWLDEHESLLEGLVIHLPAEDSDTVFAPQSGWNGAEGWQAFLQWARRGHGFDFYPDRTDSEFLTCQLAEPLPKAQPEPAAQRSLTLRLRTTDLARFVGY